MIQINASANQWLNEMNDKVLQNTFKKYFLN